MPFLSCQYPDISHLLGPSYVNFLVFCCSKEKVTSGLVLKRSILLRIKPVFGAGYMARASP